MPTRITLRRRARLCKPLHTAGPAVRARAQEMARAMCRFATDVRERLANTHRIGSRVGVGGRHRRVGALLPRLPWPAERAEDFIVARVTRTPARWGRGAEGRKRSIVAFWARTRCGCADDRLLRAVRCCARRAAPIAGT
eukprot:6180136-Pleurochrysis_carterae.AAC.4